MGDFLDAPVSVDRPGSATVQRSAMLKVLLHANGSILNGIAEIGTWNMLYVLFLPQVGESSSLNITFIFFKITYIINGKMRIHAIIFFYILYILIIIDIASTEKAISGKKYWHPLFNRLYAIFCSCFQTFWIFCFSKVFKKFCTPTIYTFLTVFLWHLTRLETLLEGLWIFSSLDWHF